MHRQTESDNGGPETADDFSKRVAHTMAANLGNIESDIWAASELAS